MKLLSIICCFCLSLILGSCEKQNTEKKELFTIESHRVLDDDHFILSSYYLSTPYVENGQQYVLTYNYQMHSLDLFSNDSVWKSVQIQKEGPDAVPDEIVSMLPVSSDSIWVYNRESFYLLDGEGELIGRHKPEYPVICDCNYAMNTAVAGWNNGILSYPVKDGDVYRLMGYNVEKGMLEYTYDLQSPDSKKDGSFYGYLELPNVNVLEDKVIYSYSYESDIYVLNLQDGKTEKHALSSHYAPKILPALDKSSDPMSWQEYGWEHPHYYMVYHLPEPDVYIRPLLRGVDVSTRKDMDTVVDEKQLVLMVLDSDFRLLDEIELPAKTYNNFHGWCALPDAFLLYRDNALGETHDDLHFDLVKIKR